MGHSDLSPVVETIPSQVGTISISIYIYIGLGVGVLGGGNRETGAETEGSEARCTCIHFCWVVLYLPITSSTLSSCLSGLTCK